MYFIPYFLGEGVSLSIKSDIKGSLELSVELSDSFNNNPSNYIMTLQFFLN